MKNKNSNQVSMKYRNNYHKYCNNYFQKSNHTSGSLFDRDWYNILRKFNWKICVILTSFLASCASVSKNSQMMNISTTNADDLTTQKVYSFKKVKVKSDSDSKLNCIQTIKSNAIKGAYFSLAINSKSEAVIIRQDDKFNIIHQFKLSSNLVPISINEFPDGSGLLVTGYYNHDTNKEDPIVIKIDMNGDYVWSDTILTQDRDYAMSSIIHEEGSLVVATSLENQDTLLTDPVLLHYNVNGTREAIEVIKFDGVQSADFLTESSNNMFMSGIYSHDKSGFYSAKFSSYGSARINLKKVTGGSRDSIYLTNSKVLKNDLILDMGYFNGFGLEGTYAFAMLKNSNNNYLWQIGYGKNGDEKFFDADSDNNTITIVGKSSSLSESHDTSIILNIDYLGREIYTQNHDMNYKTEAIAIIDLGGQNIKVWGNTLDSCIMLDLKKNQPSELECIDDNLVNITGYTPYFDLSDIFTISDENLTDSFVDTLINELENNVSSSEINLTEEFVCSSVGVFNSTSDHFIKDDSYNEVDFDKFDYFLNTAGKNFIYGFCGVVGFTIFSLLCIGLIKFGMNYKRSKSGAHSFLNAKEENGKNENIKDVVDYNLKATEDTSDNSYGDVLGD